MLVVVVIHIAMLWLVEGLGPHNLQVTCVCNEREMIKRGEWVAEELPTSVIKCLPYGTARYVGVPSV